jgi:hypothetical protein
LSAVPSLTSRTGVLQAGHARISSNSGSTAIAANITERRTGMAVQFIPLPVNGPDFPAASARVRRGCVAIGGSGELRE